jgi:hypothetical protein
MTVQDVEDVTHALRKVVTHYERGEARLLESRQSK